MVPPVAQLRPRNSGRDFFWDNSTGFCHRTAGPSPLSGAQRTIRYPIRSTFGPPDPVLPHRRQKSVGIIWKGKLYTVVPRLKNTKRRIFIVIEYFSWMKGLWLLLNNALEHSTKSKHFHTTESASKVEIIVFEEFILALYPCPQTAEK